MTDNNKKKMNSEPIFGNLAYDLNTLTWDPFDGNAVRQPQEQPQERPREPLRRPERYENTQRESRRRPAVRPQPYGSPIVVGVAVLIIMTIVLVLGYLRLTKASHEVTARQTLLQQVQEDNAALGVEYEKAFDQSAVKAAAQAAGMTKPTTDQIEYIELGGANMAEICRPESTGPLAQAWNWVRNGVDAVVEYFR